VVKRGDPDGNEAAVAAFVERWLAKEGFEVEVQAVARASQRRGPPRGARHRRALLLEGHTDVVTGR
jgi:acetylornithine deacetylase/succinyl-diaminopimelate desuccinylase-like protein